LVRTLALFAAAAVLAGCNGGTVDRHALTNDASTIDSINCEAWLVARAAARGDVTSYYAREQAEELHLQAANLADALGRRPTATGLKQRVRAKARDAAQLAALLQRLHDHSTAKAVSERLAQQFMRAGNCS
jgi:hypothetical protein